MICPYDETEAIWTENKKIYGKNYGSFIIMGREAQMKSREELKAIIEEFKTSREFKLGDSLNCCEIDAVASCILTEQAELRSQLAESLDLNTAQAKKISSHAKVLGEIKDVISSSSRMHQSLSKCNCYICVAMSIIDKQKEDL